MISKETMLSQVVDKIHAAISAEYANTKRFKDISYNDCIAMGKIALTAVPHITEFELVELIHKAWHAYPMGTAKEPLNVHIARAIIERLPHIKG